jgi:hypothetical protein
MSWQRTFFFSLQSIFREPFEHLNISNQEVKSRILRERLIVTAIACKSVRSATACRGVARQSEDGASVLTFLPDACLPSIAF